MKTTKERKAQANAFKERYKDLIERCRKVDLRMVHVTDEGKELIRLAREELGYSKTAIGSSIIIPLLTK